MTQIRVRFAPSPTGTLHVGGARTALFNWLFAKANQGKFILRIEDTDQTRYDANAEAAMIEDLKWLGLTWDEGPDAGGPHAPYHQSQRLDIYKAHAKTLLDKGAAYPCFCTPERLQSVKEQQKKDKTRQGYDRHCRNLTPEEIQKKLDAGETHVIRLKVPESGQTVFKDYLRDDITYNNAELDDLVLIKTNGFPSYHLANVVDDHQMGITHVCRGDEWIPSTPKHKLIYDNLGWEPPVFVHLPVILAPGGGKLSKRKGAASVTDYKNLGYLPSALLNFLSLLGWNPGDDEELMDLNTLIRKFTLDRIQPKSCAFDEQKLEWMNGQYIANAPGAVLLPLIKPLWQKAGLDYARCSDEKLITIIDIQKERSKRLPDLVDRCAYFFQAPSEYDKKADKKQFKPEAAELLSKVKEAFEACPTFNETVLEGCLRQLAEKMELPNAAKLIHPTRLAVSGVSFGPGMFELLALLGKEAVLSRIDTAIQYIKRKPVP